MATRYSGSLILTVSYRDATDDYSVRIRESRACFKPLKLDAIRLAPYYAQRLAVDSAEAYTRIAVAALGFASADETGEWVLWDADTDTDTGEFVVTTKRAALSLVTAGV